MTIGKFIHNTFATEDTTTDELVGLHFEYPHRHNLIRTNDLLFAL